MLTILGSKAININNSALPCEFVRYMLDPGISGDMNPDVDVLGKGRVRDLGVGR